MGQQRQQSRVLHLLRATLVSLASAWLLPHPAKAGTCPADAPPRAAPAPTQPLRAVDLADLLRLRRQPWSRLEHANVVTEGYLIRVQAQPARSSACRGETNRVYRVWLKASRPGSTKPTVSRHNAVVAVVAGTVVRDQLGGEQALGRLVGSRLSVTGRLSFNPARRGELARTRGTLWEIRMVSRISPCPGDACPAPTPPLEKLIAPVH